MEKTGMKYGKKDRYKHKTLNRSDTMRKDEQTDGTGKRSRFVPKTCS